MMPPVVPSDEQLLRRLEELEGDVKYQLVPTGGDDEFRYHAGRIPILLSAPHGAVHTRNGNPKEEDEYTSGFARLVAELTGAHAIYAWRKSSTDPNYNDSAPYKSRLKEIVQDGQIQFVLDLHGMGDDWQFGIALGTMRGQSCPSQKTQLLHALETSGFSTTNPERLLRYVVDHPKFTGGITSHTVTRYASAVLNVPAVQVELNAHLRIPVRRHDASPAQKEFRGNPGYIALAVRAISNLVLHIAKQQ